MRVRSGLGGLVVLAGVALAGPEGPPFYDRKRGLDAQEEASKKNAEEAKTSAEPTRLVALLLDESARCRDRAFGVLAARGDDAALQALLPHLGHKDEFVSAAVAELFGQRRWAAAREPLEKVGLASSSELTALESIWALELLDDAASANALKKAFERRREHRVKGDALIALAAVDPAVARPIVEAALKDEPPPVRIAALAALRVLDPKAAFAAAVDVVAAPALEKRDAAWEARLLLAAQDALRGLAPRAGERELVVRAVDALITRLAREEGLPLHELGVTLGALTGKADLEADAAVWTGWWQSRRESFQPVDPPPPSAPGAPRRRRADADPDPPAGAPAEPPKREESAPGGATSRVRFHGIPVWSKRMAFAQDMSGGMNNPLDRDVAGSPSKLQFSKAELVRVLKALPDDVHTNVVFFASEYWRNGEQLVPLARARAQLVSFVEGATTPESRPGQPRNKGRSNLYDTLAQALADPELDTVYFLSEGGPNEGRFVDRERFMRHLARLNVYQRVQVHTLQVTNDRAGAAFLRRLAEDTGGSFYGVEQLQAAH